MLRKKLFIGVLALGLSPLAFANGDLGYAPAAPAYTPGVYVGIQGGYGMQHWDYAVAGTSKNNGLAGRVFIGYDFHKNFAVEGGYTYWFRRADLTSTNHVRTWALDLVGKLKATVVDNFGVYAKAGIDYLHRNISGTYAGLRSNAGNVNVVYGVGADYDFTPNITADISWTRFNGEPKATSSKYQEYTDLFAIGVSYKFNLS